MHWIRYAAESADVSDRRWSARIRQSRLASTTDAQSNKTSACFEARHTAAWIEPRVQLGRNAVSIYQGLVESYGFEHCYKSAKRFVHALRSREPERFDALEFLAAMKLRLLGSSRRSCARQSQ